MKRGCSQNVRTYDTNDWIPITRKCSTCSDQQPAEQKQPMARVLTLSEQDRRHVAFFPSDDDVSDYIKDQQYLREIVSPQRQLKPLGAAHKLRIPTNLKPTTNAEDDKAVLNEQILGQQLHRQPLPKRIALHTQHVPSEFMLPPPGVVHVPQTHQVYSVFQTPEDLRLYQPSYQTLLLNPSTSSFRANVSHEVLNKQAPVAKKVTEYAHENTDYKIYDHIDLTSTTVSPPNPETVQLLYVPLEVLRQGQQIRAQQAPSRTHSIDNQLNLKKVTVQPGYKQLQLKPKPLLPESHIEHSDEEYHQLPLIKNIDSSPIAQHPRPTTKYFQKEADHGIKTSVNHHAMHHKEQQLHSIREDFANQALNALKLQFQLDNDNSNIYEENTLRITTSKAPPKKRKPHQPPLAVYMGTVGDVTVANVLDVLKGAQNISVQDSIGPDTPQVFVGPYNLEAPPGYAKFDLPYLNSLENNRIERRATQYPFFVAPLSYKAPSGYSKIPLPAPHVGSVVVSHKEGLLEKHPSQHYTTFNSLAYQNEQQPQPINTQVVPISPSRYTVSKSYVTPRTDPLSHTINQYELEQINSQFVPQPQNDFYVDSGQYRFVPSQAISPLEAIPEDLPYLHASLASITPAPTGSIAYSQQIPNTSPINRDKPQHAFSTTEKNNQPIKENGNPYTVLEEFSVKPEHSSTVKGEEPLVSHAPSTVGTLQPHLLFSNQFSQNLNSPTAETAKNVFSEIQPPQLVIRHPAQISDGLPIQNKSPSIAKASYEVLATNQTHSQFKNVNHHSRYVNEDTVTTQLPETASPATVSSRLPTNLSFVREDLAEKRLPGITHRTTQYNVRLLNRGKSRFELSTEGTTADSVETIETFKLPIELPEINPSIPILVNELQNHSILPVNADAQTIPISGYNVGSKSKHHLENIQNASTQSGVRFTTTPSSVTTTRRQRGRQRLRVTTESSSTIKSETRRTLQRTRKPSNTRTSLESIRRQSEQSTQSNEYGYSAATTQRTQIRQRFRTRGRPVLETTTATSGIEKYQNSNQTTQQPVPQSYMQFERTETLPSVKRVPEDEQIIQDFHQVYSVPQDQSTERLIHNKHNQAKINMNVSVTYPVTENSPVTLNSKGESMYIAPNRKNSTPTQTQTESNHPPVRKRNRTRGRTKLAPTTPATTEATTSTTKKPIPSTDQPEFYGFFRHPHFEAETTAHSDIQKPYSADSKPVMVSAGQIIVDQPNYQTLSPLQYFTSVPIQQSSKLYSAKYVSSTPLSLHYIENGQIFQYESQPSDHSEPFQVFANDAQDTSASVKFVGEIRPKYSTPASNEELSKELSTIEVTANPSTTQLPKAQTNRRRVRIKKPSTVSEGDTAVNHATQNNEVGGKYPIDAAHIQKSINRGTVHFRVPAAENASGQDDIEGENYPAPFLLGHQSPTERPKFQITVNPTGGDHDDEDQVPNASIYSPNIIAINEKSNGIPVDRKPIVIEQPTTASPIEVTLGLCIKDVKKIMDSEEFVTERIRHKDCLGELAITMQPINDSTTESVDTTISATESPPTYSTATAERSEEKRRGFWRLIKQRPVDNFDVEAAESQYAGVILSNSFTSQENDIVNNKYREDENGVTTDQAHQTTEYFEVFPISETTSTATEGGLFSSIFNIFGKSNNNNEVANRTNDNTKWKFRTAIQPDKVNSPMPTNDENGTETYVPEVSDAIDYSLQTTTMSPTSHIIWGVGNAIVRTSTSTEISHETEICYRGKCIKSSRVRLPE